MRTTIILLLLALLSTSAWSQDQPPTPEAQEITIQPGLNALPITRFPFLEKEGVLAEKLVLAGVFGPNNEAGLTSGFPETADLVWIAGAQSRWQKFFYLDGAKGIEPGWRLVSTAAANVDQSKFSWPYTTGVMIERRQKDASTIKINGVPKLIETVLLIGRGANYFNRIYDVKSTLAELQLESFFFRASTDALLSPRVDPAGNAIEILADQFVHPSTSEHYILTEKDEWLEMESLKPIDPKSIEVLGTFGIYRFGEPTTLTLSPPTVPAPTPVAAQLRPPAFLGLEEGAARRLIGTNFSPQNDVCAFLLHNNRPISLHVTEATSSHLVVHVGKHRNNVTTDTIAVVNGQGVNGPLQDISPFFRIEQSVRSFSSDAPIPDPLSYIAKLPDPEQRENERRFFSETGPDGSLFLNLDQLQWQANTLLEIDLIAATPDEHKISLHFPQIRVENDATALEFVEQLTELLKNAIAQRDLVSPNNLNVSFIAHPQGASLTINFGEPLKVGKIDICALAPVTPPVIEANDTVASVNDVMRIIGQDFGNRIEDLCILLAPIDGSGRTIPMRPVSLSADGTSILARVVGPIPVGGLLQVKMARGIGRTQSVDLGFPDVVQRQGIWAWRGIGITPSTAPNPVRPALGAGETTHFSGDLVDGNLVVTLDTPWPDNAKVSISFTANTETVQLDAYAPELYFTVSGSTEECARRLQQALRAAFIQGGMANANQIQVQVGVTVGNEVTLSAGIVNDDGVVSPITSGHLNISVSEEEIEQEPPYAEDADGDLIEDNWESDNFGMPAAEVSAFDDPDSDGLPNYMEFAFSTDPLTANATPPEVILDAESRLLIAYQRHITATNYYNFDIESSTDGDNWQLLPNLEPITIRPIGALVESIVTRSLVDAHELELSFFRIRLTPRS
jgi:hypothetical protein